MQSEFVWQAHPDADDLCLALRRRRTIRLRDRAVALGPGELFAMPRAVERRLLLIEPRGTPNTGDAARRWVV